MYIDDYGDDITTQVHEACDLKEKVKALSDGFGKALAELLGKEAGSEDLDFVYEQVREIADQSRWDALSNAEHLIEEARDTDEIQYSKDIRTLGRTA